MKLNKPFPSNRKNKKFQVRVRDPQTGEIETVHFGDKRYEDFTMHKDKKRRESFRARHRCDDLTKKDIASARYWSCEYLW